MKSEFHVLTNFQSTNHNNEVLPHIELPHVVSYESSSPVRGLCFGIECSEHSEAENRYLCIIWEVICQYAFSL